MIGLFIVESLPNRTTLMARCSNEVHDLGSAEPEPVVEPSLRCIALQQLEHGSADLVQLNRRGYTMDDADWSSHGLSKTELTSDHVAEFCRDSRRSFEISQ